MEAEHAARRDLAGYLVDRLNGTETIMYEFVGIMQSRPLPRLPGEAGAAFAIYHAEVSADSDGPVEWCRPVPADQAEELAGQYPELTLRTEPAHSEAYVHLGDTQSTPPRWQLIAQTMQAWAIGQGLQESDRAADLAPRVTFRRRPPGTDPVAPDCDYAVPFRRP